MSRDVHSVSKSSRAIPSEGIIAGSVGVSSVGIPIQDVLLRLDSTLRRVGPDAGKSCLLLLTAVATTRLTEKATEEVNVDVRMCKECNHTIFSKRDLTSELATKPPDVRAYENLVQFERGIRLMLPKFQRLLLALQ